LVDDLLHWLPLARGQELHASCHRHLLGLQLFGIFHSAAIKLRKKSLTVRGAIIGRRRRGRWWGLLEIRDQVFQIGAGNLCRHREILDVVLERLLFDVTLRKFFLVLLHPSLDALKLWVVNDAAGVVLEPDAQDTWLVLLIFSSRCEDLLERGHLSVAPR
jgi:hypothetical protein